MKLLGNTVLLRPEPAPVQSRGGIHYSHKHVADNMRWLVWRVGPGKRLPSGLIEPPEVRPGDRVICKVDGLGVKHKFDDGWCIVDASIIEMMWK
jgi:co-chaperonin GroES (HSP10)